MDLILFEAKQIFKKNQTKCILLGSGACKPIYCEGKQCSLIEKGECSYKEITFPAIEAYGINVFETAENLGIEMQVINKKTQSKDTPYGFRVGIILFNDLIYNNNK